MNMKNKFLASEDPEHTISWQILPWPTMLMTKRAPDKRALTNRAPNKAFINQISWQKELWQTEQLTKPSSTKAIDKKSLEQQSLTKLLITRAPDKVLTVRAPDKHSFWHPEILAKELWQTEYLTKPSDRKSSDQQSLTKLLITRAPSKVLILGAPE